MYTFENILKNGSLMDATTACMKQLEYALLMVLLLFPISITFFIVMHGFLFYFI